MNRIAIAIILLSMVEVNSFGQHCPDERFLNFVLTDTNAEKGPSIYVSYNVSDTNKQPLQVVRPFHNLYRELRMHGLNNKQSMALGKQVLMGDTLIPITFFHSSIYNAIVEPDSSMVSLWTKDKCEFMKTFFYKEDSFRDWDGDERTAVLLLFPTCATVIWDVGIRIRCFNNEDWCLKCRNPTDIFLNK